MEYNEVTKLETILISTLKEEYSFYQSLFILADKQRDYIKFDKEQKLIDLYGEVERLYSRIKESEQKIATLREGNRNLFALAASAPEVRRLLNSISNLISKSLKIIKENEEIAIVKHNRIKEKLTELQNSNKITNYLKHSSQQPKFVDEKH